MDGVLIDSGAHHRDAWRRAAAPSSALTPRSRSTGGSPSAARPRRRSRCSSGRRVDGAEARHLAPPQARALPRAGRSAGTLPCPGVPDVRRGARPAGRAARGRHLGLALGRRARSSRELGLRRALRRGRDRRRRHAAASPIRRSTCRPPAGSAPPPAALPRVRGLAGRRRSAARAPACASIGVTTAHTDAELLAAGAERTIADFEGLEWSDGPREHARLLGGPLRGRRGRLGARRSPRRRSWTGCVGRHVRRATRRARGRARAAAAATTRASWPRRGYDVDRLRLLRRGGGRGAARWPRATASTSPSSSATSSRSGGRPRGAFDGVWEYTCFCAIDPARREEYVRTVARDPPAGRLAARLLLPAPRGRRRPALPRLAGRGAPALCGPRSASSALGRRCRSARGRQGREWLVCVAPALIGFVDRPCAGVLGVGALSLAVQELTPQ